jgi:hypothetical protein
MLVEDPHILRTNLQRLPGILHEHDHKVTRRKHTCFVLGRVSNLECDLPQRH